MVAMNNFNRIQLTKQRDLNNSKAFQMKTLNSKIAMPMTGKAKNLKI
jgi:hypothetical protein